VAPPPQFPYIPDEYEAEKASNSYLMSLIAIMAGLPLPIVNLIASAIFFFSNRRSAFFVRWHCTQALLAQAITLVANAAGVYWTIGIVFGDHLVTNSYIAYIITIVLFNLLEFIATIYAAVRTRKGKHVVWWLFGPVTDALVKADRSG
jgi:uncharacterized Tic20 family protein